MTARVFESVCPLTVSRKLDTIRSAAPPTLKKIEPTVYSVLETSSPKSHRVRIGNPHSCTCQKKQPCMHVLAVLLFGLHVAPSNPLSWQQGLTELEMSSLLEVSHGRTEPCCRFCKERMIAVEGCSACDCQFHQKCAELNARARNQAMACPACGSVCLIAQPATLCSKCKAPTGSCFYECAMCTQYVLCTACYESKVHVQHPFRKRAVALALREAAVTETPQSLMTRELNPEDYTALLALDDDNQKSVLSEAQFAALRHPLWGTNDGGEKCPICLMPFRLKERCVCLPCGHVFHDTCGKKWLTTCKDACPIDNRKVVPSG